MILLIIFFKNKNRDFRIRSSIPHIIILWQESKSRDIINRCETVFIVNRLIWKNKIWIAFFISDPK